MKQLREFSAQSIKEKAASLPDTYYGEVCNVSLKSEHVTIKSASDGEPLRFDNFSMSLCCGGTISAEVNLSQQTVREGDFELFFPGTIYRLESISNDCELIGITISPSLLKEIFREKEMSFFTKVGSNVRVRIDEEKQSLFKKMAELYLSVLQTYGESSALGKQMTASICQFAAQECSSGKANENESKSRADELCERFIALLGEAKGTKRTISWFAEKLCVSNHYLSIVVKQSSGRSAKSLIDNAVISEIKVLLRHSDYSVSQIADMLEFPSSSFLCKYFKTLTGITPLHYRNGRDSFRNGKMAR